MFKVPVLSVLLNLWKEEARPWCILFILPSLIDIQSLHLLLALPQIEMPSQRGSGVLTLSSSKRRSKEASTAQFEALCIHVLARHRYIELWSFRELQ